MERRWAVRSGKEVSGEKESDGRREGGEEKGKVMIGRGCSE